LAVLSALLFGRPAKAQVGDEIPSANYYAGVAAIYLGEYREAERELRRESQRGLRTTLARWVDSVCYHAMLGEVLYHQGRNAEALAQFDQACQYLLAYPNWMTRVNFQRPPVADPNPARRVAPWGATTRTSVPAQFPRTEQVAFGQLNNSQVLQRGGVFAAPEYRRVNVQEIIRAAALALRRRADLLGPLAPQDKLFKDLSSVLAAGNLTPPNHWSIAWVDLQRGLVHAALGQLDQASNALNRAALAGGQFDHPLTCVALLEQGRLAMRAGNGQAAAQFFHEASLSAYYFENWDALTESVWLGWVNHMAHGGNGLYAPLEPVAAWAQLNRLQHISVKLRLAQAESLLWLDELPQAAALLGGGARPLGQMNGSIAGIHHLYLQAVTHYLQGRAGPGGEVLSQALTAQAAASLRNFQIGLTGSLYDAGDVVSREAVALYERLLADPLPAEWAYQPLDVMAVLSTPHDGAFDRWLHAALDRKDVPSALDVAERAKRRRFLASQPLGGRLIALRAILEAPERDLSREAILQRQHFLAAFPVYRQLASAGERLSSELRAGPVIARPEEDPKPLNQRYEEWRANAEERERLLMQIALRRLPSSLEFPCWRKTADLQQALSEGQALVVFHAAGEQVQGFLITSGGTHTWSLGGVRPLRTKVGEYLRDIGNFGAGRTLPVDELARNVWHKSGNELYKAIFAESRLDTASTTELIIVPDDALWNVPFEALIPDAADPEQPLGVRLPIRYGPTAALVLGGSRGFRRPQHTAIVGGEFNVEEAVTGGEDLLAELEKLVAGPLRLGQPLSQPGYLVAPLVDMLIVLDDVSIERAAANGWSPFPRSPAGAADTLGAWSALPYGGPERVIVTTYATEAELGNRGTRRGSAAPPGTDVFRTVCHLMASDAQTILLTRWRTGGRTNFNLVREFVQELPHSSAADAWRRAVLLAREAPLDINREPRLKRSSDESGPPTASHPFFWAGYLLVDTGAEAAENTAPAPATSQPAGDVPAKVPLPTLPPPDAPPGEKPMNERETRPGEAKTSK
jgi:hypothetical protein